MKISAIVLTKNEGKNIADCLETLTWCDELIVIDDQSTDQTVTIAKKHHATVYSHQLAQDFSQQRNFALEKAKGDWVFFVDADERVTKELQQEIQKKLPKTSADGYYFKRYDYLWGKKVSHGEIGQLRLLRLFKKESNVWKGQVHETASIHGKTEELIYPLIHYPHPSISEFLTAINIYSSIRAEELFKQKKHVSWYEIIFYPKAKFFQNYIFRQGFLDGIPGLILALMMSFHSFLVRGKLWQLWEKSGTKK